MSDWRIKRREEMELLYVMLDVLKDGRRYGKTRIMQKMNIQYYRMGKLLDILDGKGFILVEEKQMKLRKRYKISITEDGVRLYKELGMLRRLLDV